MITQKYSSSCSFGTRSKYQIKLSRRYFFLFGPPLSAKMNQFRQSILVSVHIDRKIMQLSSEGQQNERLMNVVGPDFLGLHGKEKRHPEIYIYIYIFCKNKLQNIYICLNPYNFLQQKKEVLCINNYDSGKSLKFMKEKEKKDFLSFVNITLNLFEANGQLAASALILDLHIKLKIVIEFICMIYEMCIIINLSLHYHKLKNIYGRK